MIDGWIPLAGSSQLLEIIQKSYSRPQLIFKHSTRCGVSDMALRRIQKVRESHSDCYFLDVLRNRNVSGEIAQRFDVHHESPQVLVIKNGECIYEESHNGIRADEVYVQLCA